MKFFDDNCDLESILDLFDLPIKGKCIAIHTYAYLLNVDNSGNKDDCTFLSSQSGLVYEES